MLKLSNILMALLLIFTINVQASEQENTTESNQLQKLEELKLAIEKIRKDTNTPAVGIALVNRDGPYWVASLGDADIEKHTKADENTMFRIASVSKMFVALSVLKLVEQGKLNLNDKLHDLAPEIQYENKWEKTNPILLVHLLEHTTGWDEQHLPETGFNASDSSSLKDALDFHPHSRTSRWVPGTRHAYNNIGPGVTAYIIEKITGKKYEDYVKENFFDKLQMNTSTFYKSDDYIKHAATLYIHNIPAPYLYTNYRPSSAMNSSPKDMANLLSFFIHRGKYNEQQLISEKLIERMEIPASNLGAKQGVTAGYGLHNHTTGHEDFGIALHGHGGELPGALTAMMYSPEIGAGYILMTNTSNGSIWQMNELLAGYLLKDAKKVKPKAVHLSAQLNSLSGLYFQLNPRQNITRFRADIPSIMKVSIENDQLHISPLFGGWVSNDSAISDNLLVNPWTGLPSVAVVNDPISGEALQVESSLYKRIPSVLVYGVIALLLLLAAIATRDVAFALIWIPRWLLRKIPGGANIKIRTWPLLATISIVTTFLLVAIYEPQPIKLGTITWVSLGIFISSLLYPVFTVLNVISVYKYREERLSNFVYWNAAIMSLLHSFFVIYLAYYGIIGFRGWAE